MTRFRRFRTPGAAALLLIAGAGAALADGTFQVSLWDKGADSMLMDDAHMALKGKLDPANMSTGTMGITVGQASVTAGKVTFDVVNDSKDMIHEMILSPVPADGADLPYIDANNQVDEDAAHHLGEVAELDPGKTGSLTVELTAGTYVLYCNIPGHFIDGMWTIVTVN